MIRKLAMAMVVSGALGSSYANALGLGEIKLNSSLNQPLDAQVKLLNVGDLSKNEILPNLGSHDDFSRAGVERVFFLTGIKFDVELDGKGGAVLHLTTDRIVREPYLNFLIELHWPSGRLLREYTALLDPPLFSQTAPAPVQQSATVAPTPAQSAPKSAPVSQPQNYNAPSVSQSSSQPSAASASSEKKDGTVRVKKNDTLWGIAKENRPDRSVTVRQTMVAIQQHNPQAFINNNINLLKSGQVLLIPEVDEIRRISSREAQTETQRQMEEWQGKKTIDASQNYSSSADDVSTADQSGLVKLVATQDEADTDAAAGSGVDGGLSDGGAASGDSSGTGSSTLEDVDALQKQLDDLQRLMTLKQEQLALLQVTQAEEAEAKAQAEAELAAAAEDLAEAEGALADEMDSVEAAASLGDETAEAEATATMVADGLELADGENLTADDSATEGVDSLQVGDDMTADMSPAAGDTESSEEAAAVDKAVAEQSRPQEGIMDILLNNPLYIGVLLVVILGGLILLGAISRRRKEEKDYPEGLQDSVDSADDDIDIPANLDDELADVDVQSASNLADVEPILAADDVSGENVDETRKLLDESDIFIAYGRYERAIEILQPAVNDKPQNTALRLKLAETYLLNKDEARFSQQETDLQAIGDASAIASLEELKGKYADLLHVSSQSEPVQQEVVEELDFDIEQTEEMADSPANEESASEDDFLSFDLDEATAESDTDAGLETTELDDLEFDLPEEVEAFDDATAVEPERHDNLVDFETDAAEENALDQELEFSLDDETPDAREADAASADDLDFLVDTDESATKLELAKAYIDMADTDAAQEILNEVVSEGSEAQQQEAKKLLENLE